MSLARMTVVQRLSGGFGLILAILVAVMPVAMAKVARIDGDLISRLRDGGPAVTQSDVDESAFARF